MFYKKIIVGLFLVAINSISLAENPRRPDLTPKTTQRVPRPAQQNQQVQPIIPQQAQIIHRPVHQQICNNCNDIAISSSIIMRSFNGDHRFYHLQSQFGEAVRRQPCFCAQRPALVNSLRQELVRLWSQASQQTIQELRDINELHYDAELNANR
jgi:hypothetical protein